MSDYEFWPVAQKVGVAVFGVIFGMTLTRGDFLGWSTGSAVWLAFDAAVLLFLIGRP